MRSRLLALSLALLWLAAPIRAVADGPGKDAAAVRTDTFEAVWKTVNDKFYDPGFNGVDWRAVHEEYAPLVAATKSDEALYPLLNKMLGELRASHFNVRPPESITEASADPNDASWGGEVGMTVRVVEGRPTVTDVAADGGAAEAGIAPGFVLTRIGDRDLGDLQRRLKETRHSPVMEAFLVRRTIQNALGGLPGSRVEVGYLDAQDKPGKASIVRKEGVGKPLKFGELPSFMSRVEASRLDGGVAYLTFNIFLPPMMDEIRAAIRSFKDAPAVIVDLRNNPGGVGAMAPAIAGFFLTTKASLGSMKMRRGEIRFIAYSQTDAYTGPLIVLVDEGSASTSEIFAGALQESGRATVIGQPSLGAVLPSVVERLPNGAIFQYAVADFKTPKGVLLEGRGVKPDVDVALRRSDFLAGRDPVLEAALKLAKQKGVALR